MYVCMMLKGERVLEGLRRVVVIFFVDVKKNSVDG